MTTVCAVARDGRVVMGADRLTNVYDRPVVDGCTKIVELRAVDSSANPGNPCVLLGFAGASALSGIVRACLIVDAVPAPDVDPQPWADSIARAVTELAYDHHLFSDGRMDASLLLGWGGHVWTLCHHVAIHHGDGIAAIGSGEGPAVGAIDCALTWPRMVGTTESLTDLVSLAVSIATARDKHSGGAPLVLSIP